MAPSSSWDGAPTGRRHGSWVWHMAQAAISSMWLTCFSHPRGLVARAVGVLDLLSHRLRDALVVIGDAALPDVGGGDGLEDPLAADLSMLCARPGLAIPHNVLALHASVGVAMLG